MNDTIKRLKLTNSESFSYQFVEEIFRNLGDLGQIISIFWPPKTSEHLPNLLVRATVYNSMKEKVNNKNRLKYPPAEFNTNYQRASTPENSMFYCTINKGPDFRDMQQELSTCFRETFSDYNKLTSKYDSICFSLWVIEKPIRLLTIYNSVDIKAESSTFSEVKKAFENFQSASNDSVINLTNEFNDYLAERYSIPVEQNVKEYMPSGIITQYMFKSLRSKGYDIDGVVFKSNKSLFHDSNLAIIPDSCDFKLKCYKVIDCELLPNCIAKGKTRFSIDLETGDFIDGENISWCLNL